MHKEESQVLYLGRWVSREHFCAFVYKKDEQRLAKSYDEYSALISSGIWSSVPVVAAEAEDAQEDNIVAIKNKRGRPCLSQPKQ